MLQLAGVFGKPDDVQAVLRVLHLDQAVQGQRHLFGGFEAAVQPHRAALIQHQHRRALVQVFVPIHLEILRHNAHRGTLALALHGVHQALLQVQVEMVAVLVSLGVEACLDADAAPVGAVAAVAADLEAIEDVAQHFGADFAHPFGRQFQPIPLAFQITGFFQATFEFPQFLQFLTPLGSEDGFQRLGIDVLQGAGLAHVPQLLLQGIDLLQLVHQVHGLLQRHVGVAAELVGRPLIGGEEVEVRL